MLFTVDAIHTIDPKNTSQSKYGCSMDNKRDNPATGINRDTRSYLFRALME